MSADNWAKCPKCKENQDAAVDKAVEELKDSYGKISLEEYRALSDQVDALRDQRDDDRLSWKVDTFREDWEICGAEDGIVTIGYGGHCTVCGLSVEFNRKITFWPESSKDDEAENLARMFHMFYEHLAPMYGYETREASAKPWADVPEKNRRLMIAVSREILKGHL